jgi:hypothetical protein
VEEEGLFKNIFKRRITMQIKVLKMEFADDEKFPWLKARASVLLEGPEVQVKLNDIRIQERAGEETKVKLPTFRTFFKGGNFDRTSYYVLPYDIRGRLNRIVLQEYLSRKEQEEIKRAKTEKGDDD